jgi:predicted deacylase
MANGMDRSRQTAVAFLAGAAVLAIAGGWLFQAMHIDAPIVKGPGVTTEAMLSDTLPSLKGTDGDTKVFVFDSGQPGGTFVLLGGTHPQEIAGMLAATLLIENAKVTKGKLIVVPQANHTGFTHTDPMEAYFHSISITRPDGSTRWFPVGMRLSNPADQWPDPDSYVHMPSGERMVGHESRNLNRNHPGLRDGTITAEVSYALTQLVKTASIVLDLHEAQPEYPVINKIVTHERAEDIAVTAQGFGLAPAGVTITVDRSPKNLHGLSHREFGDFTQARALLAETANPAMGRFRGRLGTALVVDGKEPNYVTAATFGQKGLVFVSFFTAAGDPQLCPTGAVIQQSGPNKGQPCEGWPLQVRVARHVATFQEILRAYNDLNPRTPIEIQGIPDFKDIQTNGIGKFLLPAPAGSPSVPPFA